MVGTGRKASVGAGATSWGGTGRASMVGTGVAWRGGAGLATGALTPPGSPDGVAVPSFGAAAVVGAGAASVVELELAVVVVDPGVVADRPVTRAVDCRASTMSTAGTATARS